MEVIGAVNGLHYLPCFTDYYNVSVSRAMQILTSTATTPPTS